MNPHSESSLLARKENSDPDVISNVTAPWMWWLLVGFTICLAAAAYWGFCGTLVDTVQGSGIIIRSPGMTAVVAKTSGTIEYLDIKPGSPIATNQILGRIYNPEVFFDIHKLQVEQAELQERTKRIRTGLDNLYKRLRDSEDEKKTILDKLIDMIQENRDRMLEMVKIQRDLRAKGVVSKIDQYDTLSQNLSNENSAASTLISRLEEMYSREESRWQLEENHIKLEGELFAKRQEVELALRKNQDAVWLRSDVNGVVLELLKRTGDAVGAGEQIAVVNAGDDDDDVKAIAYVAAGDGKKVRPGMGVYFSPSALPAASHGYIKGVVVSASLFPVSYESIYGELKNNDFAKAMTASGAVMRVEVNFFPDDQTASGWKWTSKNGRTATIGPGMVGSLLINTDYRRPISYVLPYLRERVFGIGKDEKDR